MKSNLRPPAKKMLDNSQRRLVYTDYILKHIGAIYAHISKEDVDKLKRIARRYLCTQEVDTLKEGLRDTASVAEELVLNPCLTKQSLLLTKQKQVRTPEFED